MALNRITLTDYVFTVNTKIMGEIWEHLTTTYSMLSLQSDIKK